jgi:predicted naringenin-chalcone synthase
MSKIIATETLVPPYRHRTPDILEAMEKHWLSGMGEKSRQAALRVLNASSIETRASVVPMDVVFSDLSFEARNQLYQEACIQMGTQVLRNALNKAGLEPDALDVLITVSCTGFMIPSMDAYLINALGLRGDILRLPVTEMGCAGGTSGLMYAHRMAQGNPRSRIAIVSVETPSLTFQKNDLSMENFVSSGIFADGASCVIIGPSEALRPRITASESYHFRDSTQLMGYRLQNSGLKIVLSREVPDTIQEHFPLILEPFLARNALSPREVQHYLFHPGGKKIILRTQAYMQSIGKDITDSIAVLQEYGNMSSSTIFFILDRFMNQNIAEGDRAYLLAFGPGFAAQSLLLQWVR